MSEFDGLFQEAVTAVAHDGPVAGAAGVNRETLPYYERRGLLGEPDRSPEGPPMTTPRGGNAVAAGAAACAVCSQGCSCAEPLEVGLMPSS